MFDKYRLYSYLSLLITLIISGCGKSQDSGGTDSAGKLQMISIGTGSQSGVYYPTGVKIAEMVSSNKTYNIKATAAPMAGSVANVNAILAGDKEFGIVQSDVQYHAWKGNGQWEKEKRRSKLRSVFSIYSEIITLVARDDSGIKSLKDLKGKRVNIGPPGSGIRPNAVALLKQVGINWETDIEAQAVHPKESPSLLQDGKIDAFFYTVGHPNAAIKEATAGKHLIRIIPIEEDDFIKARPWFVVSKIPKSFYPKITNKNDISSIAVKATFMTSSDVSDEIVYAFTKEVFENFESFKGSHEAYSTTTKENMLMGLSAPMHPGALRYFKEAGMLK